MIGWAHLAYSAAFAIASAILAGEGWLMASVVVAMALVAFHVGSRVPWRGSRLQAMGWWLPPAVLVLVLLD